MSKLFENLTPPVILITLTLVTIAGAVGFTLGQSQGSFKATPTSNNTSTLKSNAFFISQTASVRGEIIKRDGSNISIKNKQGTEVTFPAAEKITIYKIYGNSPVATAFLKVEDIELNKDAEIVLSLESNQYKIASITYLSPLPQPSVIPVPVQNAPAAIPAPTPNKK